MQGKAQHYNYYQYDVKDGLSGNTVYTIDQDKDGFLWFGTETGLSRFDGSNFKNFTVADGLYDNEIINLFIDSKNRVWIFPFKNALYYYYQGKIHNSSNDSLVRKFNLKNELYRASEDKNGNIFFLGQRKIFILSAKDQLEEVDKINNKSFYTNACGISTGGIYNLYLGPSGLNDHSEYVYEYKNAHFVLKEILQDSGYNKNTFQINPNYRILKNGMSLQVYKQDDSNYFNLKIPDHFHTISYINDSCFAISTFSKTFLYNINQRTIVDSFLINKVCNKCFSDKENNIWFATANQGVYRLSSTKVKIFRIEPDINMPVYAINFFDKSLYIGSEKNLIRNLDLKNNEIETILLKTNHNINNISKIQVENAKRLFVGSNIGLFYINNKKTSILLSDVSVKSALVYNNSIVVATDRGVFDIALSGKKINNGVWDSRATCAYKTGNTYYIGTLNGLYMLSGDTIQSRIFLGDNYPSLKDKIVDIKADAKQNLWIATENNGIIGIKNNKVVYQFTVKKGMLSNLCRCLYVSGQTIWVGTNTGINKIDISVQPFKVTSYTIADGLDCEIINCIYAKGDSVFAGTPYGITFFNAALVQSKAACSLKLLNIQSDNDNWYLKQDNINLSSNDKFLRFEYAGISFVSSADITYYYQLKGFSNEWQTTKQNIIDFQSIDPGKYEFRVYAINKYGIKSNTIFVHFIKEKPFWQLLWVQCLMLAFIGVIIWLLVLLRIKAVRKKANEKLLRERTINEFEQLALRSQMNPHFIFNSLNSIQQYVFSGNVIEANEFITGFSSLVRQTLYISSKKFITLAEELQYLEAYLQLERTKYENGFNSHIICQQSIDESTPVPPLIIQPFIENSIRHGILNLNKGKGEISIQFIKENNFLICTVEDNGIGRENSMRLKTNINTAHQSKGMELVQKRIQSLNSIYGCNITINVEDINGEDVTGTRVIIKLPLSYGE